LILKPIQLKNLAMEKWVLIPDPRTGKIDLRFNSSPQEGV
jgi:hypothetical protein